MEKKKRVSIIVAIIMTIAILQIGQKAMAERQSDDNFYHFVFKINKDTIPNYKEDYNRLTNELFEVLQKKIDLFGFKYCDIALVEQDNFVITCETSDDPDKIITVIQSEKLPIPLTLITYFKCGLPCAISNAYCRTAEECISRGLSHGSVDNSDEAISDFNKAIEIDPNSAEAYYCRGRAYHDRGNLDKAISDYTQVIKINPNYFEALKKRAMVYLYKKDYAKSWEDVHKVEAIGFKVDTEFLEKLKKASGREK